MKTPETHRENQPKIEFNRIRVFVSDLSQHQPDRIDSRFRTIPPVETASRNRERRDPPEPMRPGQSPTFWSPFPLFNKRPKSHLNRNRINLPHVDAEVSQDERVHQESGGVILISIRLLSVVNDPLLTLNHS
jgi:hypothetical protein